MTTYIKNTVPNFSSYQLTTEEYTVLLYGLDHNIPCKFNNRIHTEFEQFYQSIFRYITHTREWFIVFKNKASKHLRKI